MEKPEFHPGGELPRGTGGPLAMLTSGDCEYVWPSTWFRALPNPIFEESNG